MIHATPQFIFSGSNLHNRLPYVLVIHIDLPRNISHLFFFTRPLHQLPSKGRVLELLQFPFRYTAIFNQFFYFVYAHSYLFALSIPFIHLLLNYATCILIFKDPPIDLKVKSNIHGIPNLRLKVSISIKLSTCLSVKYRILS